MARIRDIDIKASYAGKGTKILNEFLLPLLSVATSYDRVTSFYSIDSLLAISQGIQSLWERHGRMRLILGVHSVPEEITDAFAARERLKDEVARVREELVSGISDITDELEKRRLATVTWMVEDGLLEAKVAATRDGGLFHPKTMIVSDGFDTVAAIGSSNETSQGLGGNFEQIIDLKSWVEPEGVASQIEFFMGLWEDRDEDAVVCDITEEVASAIRDGLGGDLRRFKKAAVARRSGIISMARDMPSSFFISGKIPSLYQHQERAVIEALSRWPVRVMLADEVGLGKTFEAAATMAFLMEYAGVKRSLILAPKSVLQQWQDELHEHFGIEAWLFDSARRVYVSPDNEELFMHQGPLVGDNVPAVCLVSAQYARGSRGKSDIFAQDGAILPELLVVDEAHAARVSMDASGAKKKTRLYQMLEQVAPKIPHIILATATPMQKDPEEYHAMLALLGLPKDWRNAKRYLSSLDVIANHDKLSLDAAALVTRLLLSTLRVLHPRLDDISESEQKIVTQLLDAADSGVSRLELVTYVLEHWDSLRGLFVRLHPAHLLTVRNTRRSLEDIGYVFPKRRLHTVEVTCSSDQRLLYMNIDEYLESECFSVERALAPNRRLNLGFLRSSYQQRAASSLHSCLKTLARRQARLKSIRNGLVAGAGIDYDAIPGFDLDDMDLDALPEDLGSIEFGGAAVDDSAVARACDVEILTLESLVRRTEMLLATNGDPKIDGTLRILDNCLAASDCALMFSRYTDTVDALVEAFRSHMGSSCPPFGIYDGSRALIWSHGLEIDADKTSIKTSLSSGKIRLLFCSDAASEGLNLQAARVLINVDVPWTPSRLEQRIGRIARLGQRAKAVDIYNVWYPDSVEGTMYRRIKRRFEDLNVAIGEFPDVIAERIRAAVEDEASYDAIDELQEIRNSIQARALSKLLACDGSSVTESEEARDAIIKLFRAESLSSEVQDDGTERFVLPDGSVSTLSGDAGHEESASMVSCGVSLIDREPNGIEVGFDSTNRPCAFTPVSADCGWVAFSDALNVSYSAEVPVRDLRQPPTSLPDFSALDLTWTVDGDIPECPILWPPRREKA